MGNVSSQDLKVPVFDKRYRLMKRALAKKGIRIKSQTIASELGWSNTQQSFIERGTQPFPLEQLEPLLKLADPDRSRLGVRLHQVSSWLDPLPAFAAAFIEGGLLTESDCAFVKPLPDRLRLLTTSTDLRNLLSNFRATHADINRFDTAIHAMSCAKQGKHVLKLEGLLYDFVMSRPGKGAGLVLRAAEILSRMAFRDYTTGSLRYKGGIDQGRTGAWLAIDHCLRFVGMKHGEEGPFVELVSERMLHDPSWREQDYKY